MGLVRVLSQDQGVVPMREMVHTFTFVLFSASVVLAKQQPADQSTEHMHHGMMHQIASSVKLEQQVDTSTHTITLREGPFELPAHTDHMQMPQPPDLFWTVPIEGWIAAYHPRMVDGAGSVVPGQVLHHTGFWNVGRSDFLCRNKEEHIFGAGAELTDWGALPGYGYRVRKGDRIRVRTMLNNPTDTDYKEAWLEVKMDYQDRDAPGAAAPLKNVYPAWIDVRECHGSGYDLPPGHSTKTGTVTLHYSGVLLGLGGHLHDYGRELALDDVTRKRNVATLEAKVDDGGHLLRVPIITFLDRGGYRLRDTNELRVTVMYDNPTGKTVPDGAMGIVVGYFAPDSDAAMDELRRPAKPVSRPVK